MDETNNKESGAKRDECKHHHHHRGEMTMGPIWLIGWLFTIGYVQLPFWKAVLGIIIWPWYLGNFLH